MSVGYFGTHMLIGMHSQIFAVDLFVFFKSDYMCASQFNQVDRHD